MSALKLFISKACPYCDKAVLVALEKQAKVEMVEVPHEANNEFPDWYKKINPNETVPTLQAGEKYVYESNLIAKYLDNITSPSLSLYGKDIFSRHRVEFFMGEVGDLTGAMYGLLRNPRSEEAKNHADEAVKYIESILAENQTEGPFFLNETFSMADVSVIPFLLRMSSVLPYYTGYDVYKHGPRLKKLVAAASQRESVRTIVQPPQAYIAAMKKFLPQELQELHADSPQHLLYSSRRCPFVDRSRLALSLKEAADVKLIEVDLDNMPAWYSIVNPRQTVPALVTPTGNIVHESQLIVNYFDYHYGSQGARLNPESADDLYDVDYFITNVGYFTSAMFGVARGGDSLNDFNWAANELETQLTKKAAQHEKAGNAGPYHGGKTMDAADVAVLPMLVRCAALTHYAESLDISSKYPRLQALFEAGAASGAGKSTFLTREEYVNQFKKYLKK